MQTTTLLRIGVIGLGLLALQACTGIRLASAERQKQGMFDTLKQMSIQDCNKLVNSIEMADCKRQAASKTYDQYKKERDAAHSPEPLESQE